MSDITWPQAIVQIVTICAIAFMVIYSTRNAFRE